MDKIQNWRAKNDLPFPDFPVDKIAEFKGKIEYPPTNSAAHSKAMKVVSSEQWLMATPTG